MKTSNLTRGDDIYCDLSFVKFSITFGQIFSYCLLLVSLMH